MLASAMAVAQTARVTGQVMVQRDGTPVRDASGVVVWLTPVRGEAPKPAADKMYRLTQKGKHFDPHLLVVPIGSAVLFPNQDPFFHNVFSVYEGTRFDLGLYESGTSREVRFNRPGPSYIFCNIHPEMSAVIMVMATPYYAVTDAAGGFSMESVPPGEYGFDVWYESARPEQLKQVRHTIVVAAPMTRVATTNLTAARSPAIDHKNKYGQDYEAKPPYQLP
jgi:plastocyanin